ncbi:hypothetical protein HPP92_007664 [Vanilla planifolia]|uniref:Alpha-glucan water dikinase-like N-terminal Ig-like domain-containing protein n=1 Tax=Vanilla planifolia TaxID=51239 RepID=A0A835RME2_VANPL|nr:hypothetical protein HPP92_007664 [Vanilla planifolia]
MILVVNGINLPEMRPPFSVPIKDYAIETPFKRSLSTMEGEVLHEVHISWDSSSAVAAIHFVLREETGAWFQHKGRDFRIQLVSHLQDEIGSENGKQTFSIFPGSFDQIANLLLKPGVSHCIDEESNPNVIDPMQKLKHNSDIYEEYSIIKEEFSQNYLGVTVRRSSEADKTLFYFDTNVPGDVIIHWGVCKDEKEYGNTPSPFPPSTTVFRQKALQTILQSKPGDSGSLGCFSLGPDIRGLLFVLKLNEYTWLTNKGTDFYVPLTCGRNFSNQIIGDSKASEEERLIVNEIKDGEQKVAEIYKESDKSSYTANIISGIRNLVSDISSERGRKEKNIEAQEGILREIEKLAAEAYSIYSKSASSSVVESVPEATHLKPSVELCSGTGSGHEILLSRL